MCEIPKYKGTTTTATAINKTIGNVQAELEAAFDRLSEAPLPPGLEALRALAPPRGMTTDISLRRKPGTSHQKKKIRTDADASYWDRATCEVVISFKLIESDSHPGESPSSLPQPASPLEDLVRSLENAERDPRFREFVGIKSFRDKYLVARGFTWTSDSARRHAVIAQAIDQGLVLRNSVPNPKDPSFPTTSIRVNREHPEVKRILGVSVAERSLFKPIAIAGAALSSTVMSERR